MFSIKLYIQFFLLITCGSFVCGMEISKDDIAKALFSSVEQEITFMACLRNYNVDVADYVHTVDEHQSTLLMIAVQYNNHAATEQLLNRGFSVRALNKYGQTALILSAEYGHHDIAQLLIDRGSDINAQDYFGYTVLMRAVMCDDEAMVALLLRNGADTAITTYDGQSAYDIAIQHRLENISRILSSYVPANIQNSTSTIVTDDEFDIFLIDIKETAEGKEGNKSDEVLSSDSALDASDGNYNFMYMGDARKTDSDNDDSMSDGDVNGALTQPNSTQTSKEQSHHYHLRTLKPKMHKCALCNGKSS